MKIPHSLVRGLVPPKPPKTNFGKVALQLWNERRSIVKAKYENLPVYVPPNEFTKMKRAGARRRYRDVVQLIKAMNLHVKGFKG